MRERKREREAGVAREMEKAREKKDGEEERHMSNRKRKKRRKEITRECVRYRETPWRQRQAASQRESSPLVDWILMVWICASAEEC